MPFLARARALSGRIECGGKDIPRTAKCKKWFKFLNIQTSTGFNNEAVAGEETNRKEKKSKN